MKDSESSVERMSTKSKSSELRENLLSLDKRQIFMSNSESVQFCQKWLSRFAESEDDPCKKVLIEMLAEILDRRNTVDYVRKNLETMIKTGYFGSARHKNLMISNIIALLPS